MMLGNYCIVKISISLEAFIDKLVDMGYKQIHASNIAQIKAGLVAKYSFLHIKNYGVYKGQVSRS